MRIQNYNNSIANNKTLKPKAFKSNVLTEIELACPHQICNFALIEIMAKAIQKGIKKGLIKEENVSNCVHIQTPGDKLRLLILDKTMPEEAKFEKDLDADVFKKEFEEAATSQNTEKLELSVPTYEICPEAIYTIKTNARFN